MRARGARALGPRGRAVRGRRGEGEAHRLVGIAEISYTSRPRRESLRETALAFGAGVIDAGELVALLYYSLTLSLSHAGARHLDDAYRRTPPVWVNARTTSASANSSSCTIASAIKVRRP